MEQKLFFHTVLGIFVGLIAQALAKEGNNTDKWVLGSLVLTMRIGRRWSRHCILLWSWFSECWVKWQSSSWVIIFYAFRFYKSEKLIFTICYYYSIRAMEAVQWSYFSWFIYSTCRSYQCSRSRSEWAFQRRLLNLELQCLLLHMSSELQVNLCEWGPEMQVYFHLLSFSAVENRVQRHDTSNFGIKQLD